MDDSLSEWLALREAADWAVRSQRLVERIRVALPASGPVCALDLCTGTGSNLRYLIDRLPGDQRWLAIDRDARLLDEVPLRLMAWARCRGRTLHTDPEGHHVRGGPFRCCIETRQMDLADLDRGIFDGRHLVTASALLDLVSPSWLYVLAERCRHVRAAALFSINYDGRSSCDPPEPEDDAIRDLMNLHQRTDKGLGGPAAGPDAWRIAGREFLEAGYQVEHAPSDWMLPPEERRFQRLLIEGWAGAAREIAPDRATMIADWLRRRIDHVEAGRSRIIVRHRDMAAWLPDGRGR